MKNVVSVSLADIAESIQYGYTASASKTEVGPKFLRITDIVPHQIDYLTVPYCEIDEKNFAKFSLASGDIVIARTGATVGYAKLIRNNEPSVFASYLVRIRIDSDKADSGYVGRVVESELYKRFVRSRVGGAAQPNANAKVLSSFRLPLPKRSIQIRIASILSTYDDLIENNRRRIRLLEQAARLLYKEWFVHFRFPGHEHVAIANGVPGGWKLCGMLDHPYFEFIGENIGSFDGVKRYYATADITGVYITGDGIDYNFEEKPSRAQKAPEVGSVWFARMQATHKVLVFTETNRSIAESSILSSGFAGFRVHRAEFLPWLYLLINNERFHEEKDRYCTGATQRSLTNSGLKSIQVIAPPEQVVGAFADSVGSLLEQILVLQALNGHLKKARDIILPRLMSGAVTV